MTGRHNTRWLVLKEKTARLNALQKEMMARKAISGTCENGEEKRYTDVRNHPADKNLEAFTFNAEDIEIAKEVLTPAEFLSLRSRSEMLADGWFPSPQNSPGAQSLQQALVATVTPPPAEKIPRMQFLQRHKWKVAGAVAAASAAAAVAYHHYFG